MTIAASRASTTNRLKDPTLDPVIREATHTNSKGLQTIRRPPLTRKRTGYRRAPGKFWFPYFRLYAPTEAYFDRSWPLPDIELVT